jgi:hypothetical protein
VELRKKGVQESRAQGAETVCRRKEAALAASEFELNHIKSTLVGVGDEEGDGEGVEGFNQCRRCAGGGCSGGGGSLGRRYGGVLWRESAE